MTKRKVVSLKNMPVRMPIMTTINCWLIYKYVGVPEIWQGVMITFLLILWIGYFLVKISGEEEHELFKD